MKTQQLLSLVDHSAKKPIQFFAHHWGKYELINPQTRKGNHTIFAKSLSLSFPSFLSYHDNNIFLHNEGAKPKFISSNVEEFISRNGVIIENKEFDHRKTLASIINEDQILVTPFNDPEAFEEIDAYLKLIHLIDNFLGNTFSFDTVEGQEINQEKLIKLKTGTNEWNIKLEKALFDNQIIASLNDILKDLEIDNYKLYTSINKEMFTQIFKLSVKEAKELDRMGLLI